MQKETIVIIGNGVAGITAARHVRKLSDHRIVVVSSESEHFFSRTALMYIYMGQMKYEHTKPYEDWFWKKNRIDLVHDHVEEIDVEARSLKLRERAEALSFDKLLIATGSESNYFGWPGQDLQGVQALYSLQDLELMEANTKNARHAVILGGGLIGVEMAEMLQSRGIHVTYLIREASFAGHFLPLEEGSMVSRHLREHGVDLRHETELKEILPDADGRVRAVVTSHGEEIPCEFVGITVGVHPNIRLVKETAIETNRGILVDEHLETSVPGIYAAGDCVEMRAPRPGRRPIEPIWYTGKMQGEVVGRNICGETSTYDPGIWFNSAKFFDIEYQVYGDIRPDLPEDQASIYWEDRDAHHAIRINYERSSESVIGFNLMGVRYRHEICEAWIREGRRIDYVLENLGAANFDPEFFTQHEEAVVEVFRRANPGRDIQLQKRRGLFAGIFG